MGEAITKIAYARRHGVTPSAVSRWIDRHHLTSPALLPDGRIDPEAADAQLRERLDDARHATDMDHSPDEAAATSAAAALIERRRVQAIEEADLKLRRLRRDELVGAGTLVRADTVARVQGRLLEELLAEIEQWLPELTAKLGAGREGVDIARREWRAFRQRQAEADDRRAAGLPELVETTADG
jgi:hypothetical protein